MPGGVPEGWTFDSESAGGIASIVLPAATNVSRVLTHVYARIMVVAAGITDTVTLDVLDGVTSRFQYVLFGYTAIGVGKDTDSIDVDLTVVGTPSTSMTVHFTTNGAAAYEQIIISGYDL